MPTEPVKVKYLNNRDLLKEIHLSKNTFCSYLSEADSNYDLILENLGQVDDDAISRARKTRCSKIERETKEKIDPLSIAETDLVFRVMTWDHIPVANHKKPSKKKNDAVATFMKDIEIDEVAVVADQTADSKATHVRVNFPPFQHFRLTATREPVLVGKSHWVGDHATGEFSKTHGQITDNLARMIIKLCEKNSSRANYRGYSYKEEMIGQAIMQLCGVILQFNESRSNNPFAYATTCVDNSFIRILNIEKRNQKIRDDLLEQNGLNPSFSRQNSNVDYE
jgi:hypothetical protein